MGVNKAKTNALAGRGRPPLPREAARSIRVVTFLTTQEKAELDVLVEARDISISAACYELIKEGLDKRLASNGGAIKQSGDKNHE